jgi:adenylylsulfate kinase
MIIWLTGQPGAGKTTLVDGLADWMQGPTFTIIDGDELRDLLENPGYDKAGRHINIDRAQAIAAYMDQRVDYVLVALVAPYRKQRDEFREAHDVLEVYVHTTDIRGREEYHVDDYEPPEGDHYIDLDTTGELAVDSLRRLHRAVAATPQRS